MKSYEFFPLLAPILEESMENGCLHGGIDCDTEFDLFDLLLPDAIPFDKRNPLKRPCVRTAVSFHSVAREGLCE